MVINRLVYDIGLCPKFVHHSGCFQWTNLTVFFGGGREDGVEGYYSVMNYIMTKLEAFFKT